MNDVSAVYEYLESLPFAARLDFYLLTNSERALIRAMCSCTKSGDGKRVFASLAELANRAGQSRKTAQRIIHGYTQNGKHHRGLIARAILTELAPANGPERRAATYQVNWEAFVINPARIGELEKRMQRSLFDPAAKPPSPLGQNVQGPRSSCPVTTDILSSREFESSNRRKTEQREQARERAHPLSSLPDAFAPKPFHQELAEQRGIDLNLRSRSSATGAAATAKRLPISIALLATSSAPKDWNEMRRRPNLPGSEDFLNAQLNRMAVNWHRKYEGIDVQITRADFGRLLADVGKERFACAVQACIDTLIFFPSIAEFRQHVPPPTPRRPRNADDEERLTPQEKLAKWKRESKGQETFGIADLIAEKLPHKSEYDPNYKPELSDEELDALRSAKKAELQQQTNDALARFTEAPEETLVAPDSIKIDTATDMPYRLPGRFTRQEAPTSYQMPFSRARRRSIA